MGKKPFQRKDRFYFKAKEEGYPARSAYKIMELDDRFKIFKNKNVVVDLGCAPGGWLKVAQERLRDKGLVVGIDLLPLHFSPGPKTFFLQDDFTTSASQEWLAGKIPHGADWILSDMSPNASGQPSVDHLRIMTLVEAAFEFGTGLFVTLMAESLE